MGRCMNEIFCLGLFFKRFFWLVRKNRTKNVRKEPLSYTKEFLHNFIPPIFLIENHIFFLQ